MEIDLETSYAYNKMIYDMSRKVAPILRLIRRYINREKIVPKVILIPESRMKKYAVKNVCSLSMYESILGVKIRFYKGTKTEVY